MRCPNCSSEETKVLDSRHIDENNSIRRRRECLECHTRFNTYEMIDVFQPVVLKKDGSKEYFDKNKLLSGLMKACQKRPVDAEAIADDIEGELVGGGKREVTSTELGEMVMNRLRTLDGVAYVRFASVYREFKDVETFMHELETMLKSAQE